MVAKTISISLSQISNFSQQILAMENSGKVEWNRTHDRGKELEKIIKKEFPKVNKHQLLWIILWVDLYIDYNEVCNEDNELIVLMSRDQAIEILMDKALRNPSDYDREIENIEIRGSLLSGGIATDQGDLHYVTMDQRLAEIEAIAFMSDLEDDLTKTQVSKLGKSRNTKDRAKAARNSSASPEILETLSSDSSDGIRFLVALNPNTPKSSLTKLANDPVFQVQLSVLGNPSTDVDLRRKFIKSKENAFRLKIASNRSATPEELEALSKDKEEIIRETVAENENAPDSVLEKLAVDSSYPVRVSIAYRENLSAKIRKILSEDESEEIRDIVNGNE